MFCLIEHPSQASSLELNLDIGQGDFDTTLMPCNRLYEFWSTLSKERLHVFVVLPFWVTYKGFSLYVFVRHFLFAWFAFRKTSNFFFIENRIMTTKFVVALCRLCHFITTEFVIVQFCLFSISFAFLRYILFSLRPANSVYIVILFIHGWGSSISEKIRLLYPILASLRSIVCFLVQLSPPCLIRNLWAQSGELLWHSHRI